MSEHQRHPLDRAVFGEFGDVQRAFVQKVHVGRTITRVVFAGGDEFVHVVETLVVAEVEDHAPIRRDDAFGAFMLEAAKRRAFLRCRGWVHDVHLDHPAEAVRLVRLLGQIETVVELEPLIGRLRHAEALIVRRLAMPPASYRRNSR